jgi:hypothetical protein
MLVTFARFCSHAPPNSIGLLLDALRSTLPRFPDALTLTTVTVTVALLRLSQLLYSTASLQFVRFYLQLTLTGDDVLTYQDAR